MQCCSIQAAPVGSSAFFLPCERPKTLKAAKSPHKRHPGCLASFLCATFFGLAPMPAFASAGQLLEKGGINNDFTNAQQLSETPLDSEKATEAISGSRFPGCLDHLLIRPSVEEKSDSPQVHINYPSTGNRNIDEDIRSWVVNLADIFAEYTEIPQFEDSSTTADLPLDRFLNDDDLNLPVPDESKSSELWGDYAISFPSENALSITFEIWNYAGNDQHNLDILTLNYSKINGQRLELVDIFENPELALQIMSDFSRQQLEKRLGGAFRPKVMLAGTEPAPENFGSLTLVKDGIQINFQPYQVASGDAGAQKVLVPLTELLPAGPLLALWDK